MTTIRIGTELKKAREKKRLSQQEVADYLNVSQKTISNIESEKSLPSLIHLISCVELYEMDLHETLKKIRFRGKITITKKDAHDSTNSTLDELKIFYERLIKEKDTQITILELNYKELIKELKRVNIIDNNHPEV